MDKAKSAADEREAELESKATTLESSLEKMQHKLAQTRMEVEIEKEGMKEILKREKEDAERMVKAANSAAFQEKRVLEKEIESLETKLDKAKMELITAQEEVMNAKTARLKLEEELNAKERLTQEKMDELEQRIEADEMFRVRSKENARKKLESVALKFQRKLADKEDRFKTEIQSARDEAERRERTLEKEAKNDKISIYMEKHAAVAETRAELEAAIREIEQKLAERGNKSAEETIQHKLNEAEKKIAALSLEIQRTEGDAELMAESVENDMKQTLSEAEAHLAVLKEQHESQIQEIIRDNEQKLIAIELSLNKKIIEAKEEKNRTRADLLREKEEALSAQRQEGQKELMALEQSLHSKLRRAEAEIMQQKIDMRNMTAVYDSQRRSFRKLGALSLKLAKERITNLRQRLFGGRKKF